MARQGDSTSIPEGRASMVAAAREGAKRDLKGMKVGLIKGTRRRRLSPASRPASTREP